MRDIRLLFGVIWKAALGISSELLLVYFFIFVGFLTCIIWWIALK